MQSALLLSCGCLAGHCNGSLPLEWWAVVALACPGVRRTIHVPAVHTTHAEVVHQVLSLLARGLGVTFWISELVPASERVPAGCRCSAQERGAAVLAAAVHARCQGTGCHR